MSILITGGAGFIGKNLILYTRNKIKDKRQIIVIDNFKTSSFDDFQEFSSKIDSILLYACDIVSLDVWESIKDFKVDEIYHLASIASPILYKKNPLDTLDVGYIGTRNVMNYSLLNKSRVLFASSSEVYGEAMITPQHENYYGNTNIFGERSSYDCSKRVGEALMYTYKNSFNADIRIARIFNTYGPYMDINDGRLVTELIKSVLTGNEMTVYGCGLQRRSMCFVDDTVSMLYALMQSKCDTPVNIGSDNEMSVNDIIKALEIDVKTVYKPITQNDPLHRRPCLLKNKRILGHKDDYVSLHDGLKRTLEYFTLKNV